MGAQASKQQIGERVKNAKQDLAESTALENEQFERLSKHSPETLNNMLKTVEIALQSFSPFPETTLMMAFRADSERVIKALTACTEKVLTAPIRKAQHQWFMQYVLSSMVWFKKMENGVYLYQEMMNIVNLKQEKIIDNMDSIFNHLKTHSQWKRIRNIKNETFISRQDDEKVGLLQESGVRNILELKDSDDETEDINGLKNFIDNNLALNILMTTAKKIDGEFQKEMRTILSRHGEYKPGPMKKVERALSKMENDYMDESYPKSAKLLDIVRCSVGYNTVTQLLDGYNAAVQHIQSGHSSMELARIKNGFLYDHEGGYRDIKLNVVYHSTLHPEVKMICEVQFILNQYLYEKKRVHKLYSIAREQTYFDMVALEGDELDKQQWLKGMQFEQIFTLKEQFPHKFELSVHKSSIDSDLGFLGWTALKRKNTYSNEFKKFFVVVDMRDDFKILETLEIDVDARYTHHWITINDQKYLSLQTGHDVIQMFKVLDSNHRYRYNEVFEWDESLQIALDDGDRINYCEYDQSFTHVFILKNHSIFEKRSVGQHGGVVMSIALDGQDGVGHGLGEEGQIGSISKLMALSNDGKYAIIGLGCYKHKDKVKEEFQFPMMFRKKAEPTEPTTTKPDMNKYDKMKKMGLPERAVRNKMRLDGVEEYWIRDYFGGPLVPEIVDSNKNETPKSKSNFFYFISVDTEEQFKLTSPNLTNTFAPCFIDGDSKLFAIGGDDGEGVEIWSVADQRVVHYIVDEAKINNSYVSCTYSANGILAVGYMQKGHGSLVVVYDVSSWHKVYRHSLNMCPQSLFLSTNNRYLTVGGTERGPKVDEDIAEYAVRRGGMSYDEIADEGCVVLKIH